MHTSFREFENLRRMYSPLDENDIQFVFKQSNSKFMTYKIPPGAYTFKYVSEVLSRGFKKALELRKIRPNHKHDKLDSIIIESDNVILITKLVFRHDIKYLRLDKKSFFNTILGLSPY